MNLVVAVGAVRFVLLDDRPEQPRRFQAVLLSPEEAPGACYARLTVPPGIWMAFAGAGPDLNLILNLASIGHDPTEADNLSLDQIDWHWG
jgi:dTDP-4-dehydrorhamnose 3,5-epimerase